MPLPKSRSSSCVLSMMVSFAVQEPVSHARDPGKSHPPLLASTCYSPGARSSFVFFHQRQRLLLVAGGDPGMGVLQATMELILECSVRPPAALPIPTHTLRVDRLSLSLVLIERHPLPPFRWVSPRAPLLTGARGPLARARTNCRRSVYPSGARRPSDPARPSEKPSVPALRRLGASLGVSRGTCPLG